MVGSTVIISSVVLCEEVIFFFQFAVRAASLASLMSSWHFTAITNYLVARQFSYAWRRPYSTEQYLESR